MRNYDQRLHESVKAAVKCLTTYAPADDPRFARARGRLAAHLARLDVLHFELYQAPVNRKAGRGRVRILGHELRQKHLIPIGRHGRELLAFAPGAEPAFTVPHKRAGADALLESAARMLKLLKPRQHVRLFLDAAFPKAFLTDFRQCAARLRSVVGDPEGALRKRQADAAAYAAELRAARKEMRIVDPLVVARADTDSQFLYMWRVQTRVTKRLGRPKRRRRGPGQGPSTAS